jgi:hypothetical protein
MAGFRRWGSLGRSCSGTPEPSDTRYAVVLQQLKSTVRVELSDFAVINRSSAREPACPVQIPPLLGRGGTVIVGRMGRGVLLGAGVLGTGQAGPDTVRV